MVSNGNPQPSSSTLSTIAGPGGWAGTFCHGWQVQSHFLFFFLHSFTYHTHTLMQILISSLLGASVLATHTLLLPQHDLGGSQARCVYLLNPSQPAPWVFWSDRKQWRHGGFWITGQWGTNRSAKWTPHPPCPLPFSWTLLITLSLYSAWPGYHLSFRPKSWSLSLC